MRMSALCLPCKATKQKLIQKKSVNGRDPLKYYKGSRTLPPVGEQKYCTYLPMMFINSSHYSLSLPVIICDRVYV